MPYTFKSDAIGVPRALVALIDLMRSTIGPQTNLESRAKSLAKLSSQEIFKLAGQHNVLWSVIHFGMSGADPENSDPFLVGLSIDIRAKAESISQQLAETIAALSPICEPMVLKGACFIAEDDFTPQPWRHMVDLDFLVRPTELVNAVDALKRTGYEAVRDDGYYHPALHNHYPLLSRSDRPVGVELHERCVREKCGDLLSIDRLWRNATKIESGAGSFYVPSANDRMIHLIVHAQIGSHYARRRLFHLRDAVDFLVLARRNDVDLEAVSGSFARANRGFEFLTFVRMAEWIWQEQFLPASLYSHVHDQWVRDAFNNIYDSRSALRYLVHDLALQSVETVVQPSRWPVLMAQLNPSRMRDYIWRLQRGLNVK